MERRFGWASFPGLLKYYAFLHLLVYIVQIVSPGIGVVLEFDRQLILSGEIWRVVTFLFASSGVGGVSPLGALFLFFMVRIAMLISDTLENVWGIFRTTMFFYFCVACLVVGNFFLPALPSSGFIVYTTAFFAMATLFPKLEFLLLVIPVQIRFIALISLAFLVILVIRMPVLLPFALLAHANYILWVGIPVLRGRKTLIQAANRRKRFKAAQAPEDGAFHRCKTCQRTENSDPTLEFRVGHDGEEYCGDHLPGANRRVERVDG